MTITKSRKFMPKNIIITIVFDKKNYVLYLFVAKVYIFNHCVCTFFREVRLKKERNELTSKLLYVYKILKKFSVPASPVYPDTWIL